MSPADAPLHPRAALFGADEIVPALPVCDHYAGVEDRMRKSLALQSELGPVFDVTLDCEDGARSGGEIEQAHLVCELANAASNRHGRVGVRCPGRDHPAFERVVDLLVAGAGERWAYVTVPKVGDVHDWRALSAFIDERARHHGLARALPLHALVETHAALADVAAIAADARVECLSFGLMDFVSAHHGAIPFDAMTVNGQFEYPLVVRAKLEISAACHAHAKTPSHGVVTEFTDMAALSMAARRACRQFGYTRMWSIHPKQIPVIVEAFAPPPDEIELAREILLAAQAARWAPTRHRHRGQDRLHDRASYRYYWYVLARAERTGRPLPADVRQAFFAPIERVTA